MRKSTPSQLQIVPDRAACPHDFRIAIDSPSDAWVCPSSGTDSRARQKSGKRDRNRNPPSVSVPHRRLRIERIICRRCLRNSLTCRNFPCIAGSTSPRLPAIPIARSNSPAPSSFEEAPSFCDCGRKRALRPDGTVCRASSARDSSSSCGRAGPLKCIVHGSWPNGSPNNATQERGRPPRPYEVLLQVLLIAEVRDLNSLASSWPPPAARRSFTQGVC